MEKGLNGLFDPENIDVRTYSPLTLAFMGDAVFELMVRTMVVTAGNTAPEKLHKRTTRLVKAESQAIMGHGILEELSEEDDSVYRQLCRRMRGENNPEAQKKAIAALQRRGFSWSEIRAALDRYQRENEE